MEWKRSSRPRPRNKPPIFYCISIFFFSFCALFSSIGSKPTCEASTCPMSAKADQILLQESHRERTEEESMVSLAWRTSTSLARRFLGGPGSSPPRCTLKCGKCTPCKPIHVPVPPGTPVTAEYYPEAWRCKCGNRLYMP
ncbi:EPIDERMAL PATTERNING FACTOR-like protein 6 [Juglans microcarpa x Juglans regia]|uniref:EPIDERMAL PATTERNING FACTOR-like protein 6 n=1 Tax=Juglans microcarpa x Juglans regia TaxID=2249226 RepID=UPI001B7EF1BA|nr:EPIDERMAL PATTERNING FACTOR-like protein 6 [Juglans microcarpa x Juglans regia]